MRGEPMASGSASYSTGGRHARSREWGTSACWRLCSVPCSALATVVWGADPVCGERPQGQAQVGCYHSKPPGQSAILGGR